MKIRGPLGLLVVIAAITTLDLPTVSSQTCRWDGTAPFCSGECAEGETEMNRLDKIPDYWTPPYVNVNPPFGSSCLTGSKALCCKGVSVAGATCRWYGTAPICAGECPGGARSAQPPPGSYSGASCWTGSKVYCCSQPGVSGTVGQRLEVVNGVIYGITLGDDLLWYRHDGRTDGTFRWAAPEGKKVGQGWHFKQVFSGGDGVIYAINDNDDLLWYRHDGQTDGTWRWAAPEGKKVGQGWHFNQVFSSGGGIIYAINDKGDLLWYRHDGRNDGTFRWLSAEGKKVGSGWNFRHVFSGGEDGVIYAIADNGDLLWYRHDGRNDGSFAWFSNEGKKVGTDWYKFNILHAFSE